MIDTAQALARLVATLAHHDRIAVDTEADSLHCYHEKLCLVQIGTGDADELVDPLAAIDLAPLLAVLARAEIVLHGADFDLRMLLGAGMAIPARVFDTMIAARLTGATRFGYAALVAARFGVTLPKGSQKANWGRRPLSPTMVRYARNDTHYLLELARELEDELARLGRLEWLAQSCARAVDAAQVVRERDADSVWRVRGSADLEGRARAVLRALWRWRDGEARRADRPPFHILGNDELVDAARRFDRGQPLRARRLRGERRGALERAAAEALALDPSEWPRRPPRGPRRPPRANTARLARLRRHRDRVAADLALDPSLIAPRAALERIATDRDEGLAALMPWQRSLLEPAA